MSFLRVLVVTLIGFWLGLGLAKAAADADVDALRQAVDERRSAIEEAGTALADPEAALIAVGETLRRLRQSADASTAPVRERKRELMADLERLGPPPEEDGAPEAPEIAAERKRLQKELAQIDAIVRQSDLNIAEIDRLIADIQVRRREIFYDQLLARSPSPVTPRLWPEAAGSLFQIVEGVTSGYSDWRAEKVEDGTFKQAVGATAFACAFALMMFMPVRGWINRSITRRIEGLDPSHSRRVLAAGARMAARGAPGLIGGFVIYETLRAQGLIPPDASALARAIWFGFVAVLVVDGAKAGVFDVRRPNWAVAPLRPGSARLIRLLLMAATVLLVADAALERAGRLFGASNSYALLLSAGVAIALSLTLYGLCRRQTWRVAEERDAEVAAAAAKSWRRLRRAGRAFAVLTILITLAGYVALGHYAATRIYAVGGLAALAWLFRALLREGVRSVDHRFSSDGPRTDEGEQLAHFWIGAAIDVVVAIAFAAPVLLVLGADWADIRNLAHDAVFGFQIGSVRISVAQILTALGVFVGLLAATRFLQRQMETRFLPRTRLDAGLRNSFKTLAGYVGLVIAFLAGVGMLGLDLSNLAIIAGALSVGIGFGLQSIVNNFVSGLILLLERPIKVGDWIITQSGEGHVKRISVRSTEIETFDRSSVIIPNSELISQAVTNWTYKDKIGRVIIPVGVSYSSDPEEVIEVLVQTARDHPDVVDYPAPFVYFDDFGDSSLNFQLRAYLRDVERSLTVRTQLRVAVFKALQAAGVEIPFPQRDLHWRTGPPNAPEPPAQLRPVSAEEAPGAEHGAAI